MFKNLPDGVKKNWIVFICGWYFVRFVKQISGVSVDQLKSRYWLAKFVDKFKGRRCFIIGNGPSLKGMDLSLLKDEYTFGLNRFYLEFPRLGFKTTFLVSINKLLIGQVFKELDKQKITKFISYASRKLIRDRDNTVFVKTTGQPGFATNFSQDLWEGSTVTYVAMQLAYLMGFKEVILIGVDHNFETKGKPGMVVKQTKDDPNHFSPNYFKGLRWQLPDLVTSEMAYRLAKYIFEQNGRRIINATKGGKLSVYPRVRYEDLFLRPNKSER